MMKASVIRALVNERLTAAAEDILSVIDAKMLRASETSRERWSAAVHERLSAVAEELCGILETIGGREATRRRRKTSDVTSKDGTHVRKADEPSLVGPDCVREVSSESRSSADQQRTCGPPQKPPQEPQRAERGTPTTTEAHGEHCMAPSSDREVLPSKHSEAGSEDSDSGTDERAKGNDRKTHRRQNEDGGRCETCGRSFRRSLDGQEMERRAGRSTAATACHAGGQSRCRVCGKCFRYRRSFLKHVLRHERSADAGEKPRAHVRSHDEESGRRGPADSGRSGSACPDAASEAGDGDWKETGSEAADGERNEAEERASEQGRPRNKERRVSPRLGYRCRVCDKSFCYRASFLKHVQEDEREASLCGVCGQGFESEEALRLHLQTYARTSDCEVCGKHFDGHKQLEMHMRTHTGERPYVCAVCGKAFAQNGNLTGHMRVHTGERPYACSVCGQSFGFKEYMTAHMRIHTGEKPFLCSVCGKGFRQRGTLKTHAMIHTGESRHRCGVCDKSFYKSGALKIHMRSHTGERPYLCNVCGRGFSAGGSLTKHMGAHHRGRSSGEPLR